MLVNLVICAKYGGMNLWSERAAPKKNTKKEIKSLAAELLGAKWYINNWIYGFLALKYAKEKPKTAFTWSEIKKIIRATVNASVPQQSWYFRRFLRQRIYPSRTTIVMSGPMTQKPFLSRGLRCGLGRTSPVLAPCPNVRSEVKAEW